MSALETALQQFEAAEANLEKLERLWEKISALIPDSPAFGAPPEYDELCMAFRGILPALPAMGGVRVKDLLYDYDNAGQMRLDALEVGCLLYTSITPHLFVTELRTIDSDELWMSMAYQRRSLAIHFTWKPEWPEVRTILPPVPYTHLDVYKRQGFAPEVEPSPASGKSSRSQTGRPHSRSHRARALADSHGQTRTRRQKRCASVPVRETPARENCSSCSARRGRNPAPPAGRLSLIHI